MRGSVSARLHFDHCDLGRTVHTQRKPRADSSRDIQVGLIVTIEARGQSLAEHEVVSTISLARKLAAVRVATEREWNAAFVRGYIRLGIVCKEQVRARDSKFGTCKKTNE